MTYSPITHHRILSALVIACATAAFFVQPAAAQTAGNLKCKGCVNSKDLKKNAVKTNRIRNNAVTNSKIANDAITGAKVADGSLTAVDLGDGAGVDFVGDQPFVSLDLSINTVVRSVTVTAPRSGFVILNASGTFNMFGGAAVQCSLTTGSTLEEDRQSSGGLADSHTEFFGMTEGFVVPMGSTTFNLVCREDQEGVSIFHSDLTAMYFPTQY